MNFIQKTMDEMDCILEMKGYYIVMDNAPIHTSNEIDTMVTEREREDISAFISLLIPLSLILLSNFGP
ncbi:uncharacterized protein BX663DRAFT_324779 [Cokeromyces recurvatus]|uniref:uncharacterized protein n=1 Tax=Cokeromyces recurvatus TaxID=90255 RepID=UPI00221E9857|nr:uncharacterized protein BX663DRAFT_324779 [Cokeromyces recurvatus]KAI7904673.1 hypothetical protein BX663DRAFT_324779 [Cokeromyces recurvatus]